MAAGDELRLLSPRSGRVPRRGGCAIGCVGLLTLALGLVSVPGAGDAQPAGKVYRVGFLGNSTATLEATISRGAARLRLTIPPTVLVRAAQIIE